VWKARRIAMSRLNVTDARCEALFASGLQRSDAPTAEAVAGAISRTIRQLGSRGCSVLMAQEFGDHPESAVARTRWVRRLVDDVFAAYWSPTLPVNMPHALKERAGSAC
jgi:hypothetical protein